MVSNYLQCKGKKKFDYQLKSDQKTPLKKYVISGLTSVKSAKSLLQKLSPQNNMKLVRPKNEVKQSKMSPRKSPGQSFNKSTPLILNIF